MKVKLLTSVSGADGSFGFGEIVELPNDYATRMLNSGQAEAIEPPPVKTAAKRTKKG